MRIDINQHKISIGDKYDIFIDSEPAYNAANELFRLLSVTDLFDNTSALKMKIKKKWAWWGAKYDLLRDDNHIFFYRTISVWKLHYRCSVGADVYDVYGHRGRKHSVYKNDIQVAWWNKEAITWFDGDNYTIVADNNADAELLISFCLLMDNYGSKSHDETVTVDIGNIGFQAKKFNPDWQPAYKK